MNMDPAIKEEKIPAGGIADFIYTDEELNVLEDQELEQVFGASGIAQFKKIGKKIAEYGRYGDDTVAHVEKGELIVPRALIEDNPELKESIFSHLKELGVEDPERYVVGTSKNSINPDTGLPEFFLSKLFKGIKKGVSSIGRGVSKALKGVGRALKKAAPIIIPLALNFMFPGLGAVYSGALGAGIGTLVQGGSVQDAFKSAVLGGATGAVSAGVAGEGPFLMRYDVETEVHVKRALCYLGDGEFKMVFNAEELDSLNDEDFTLALQLTGKDSVEAVKKHLLPKKKTTTQKVVETVTSVASAVTPTTTNDQSSDEATLANDSE